MIIVNNKMINSDSDNEQGVVQHIYIVIPAASGYLSKYRFFLLIFIYLLENIQNTTKPINFTYSNFQAL